MAVCADEHWHDADFAVLKIDLHNAFNQVSRQASMPVAFTFRNYSHGPHGATVSIRPCGTLWVLLPQK